MQESLQIPDTHGKTRESTGPANKPLVPGSSAASIDQPTLARQEDDATGVDLFVSGATSIRSCPNCPLTLFSSEDLAAHTAAYKHLCSHCPRHFVSRKDLNRHVATVHENNSTPCPITGCEYSGRQDNLRRHMRTMHGAEPENATKVAVTPSEKPGGDGDGTVSMQVDESEEDEFDADE
jgi:hypothetical protein